MQVHTTSKYSDTKVQIEKILESFEQKGELIGPGKRNKIKIFQLGEEKLNVKSFKIPIALNRMVYRYFRKSKAQRSFLYAQKLKKNGIGTPEPVAFAEDKNRAGLGRSFYISLQQAYDMTYREIDLNLEGHEEILRAFTRFTWKLHENKVEFLDHSPGNTLIQLKNEEPEFFLVDLNRMHFRKLDFEARMKNFARLSPIKEVVAVMASEYAKCIDYSETEVFDRMWAHTKEFQGKFWRKQRLKQKLGLKK